MISAYGEAAEWWWTSEEIAEAARRLMAGVTAENWTWVNDAPNRNS
jgi:hypothetical protein